MLPLPAAAVAAAACCDMHRTCWFHDTPVSADGGVQAEGDHNHHCYQHCPLHLLLLLLLAVTSATIRRTCWFHEASVSADGGVQAEGDHKHHDSHAPLTTLLALEHTIQQRREAMQQQQGATRLSRTEVSSWQQQVRIRLLYRHVAMFSAQNAATES
jgi:hypothetical protein